MKIEEGEVADDLYNLTLCGVEFWPIRSLRRMLETQATGVIPTQFRFRHRCESRY